MVYIERTIIMSKKNIELEVKAECSNCHGTGLYAGFAEGRGQARVCITCRGTGCENIIYKPFNKRRRMRFANGAKLIRVFVDGPIWSNSDERKERTEMTPKEFYQAKNI